MPKPCPPLAERIRREITRRRLSGYAVAKAIGVSPNTIQRFMRGTHTPTLETIERLLDLLGWQVGPTTRRSKP